ncbi:MAG: DEAD/DEAH box helicase family protein [Prevotella sp.]|nr:DEAD/DEAH box helicase family protein [Prevotella sp.]MDY4625671.1 DEAD/DEAH box helicase family protein [Prevotella sp.]
MPTFLDKSLSEQDIRDRFITPALEQAGWDAEHRRAEYSFTAGAIIVNGTLKHRKQGKRADYILLTKENYPIAVVEAKDYNHTPSDGIQQAIDYAEILDIPFAYSSNGEAFVEHDMLTGKERTIENDNFPTPLALRARLQEHKRLTMEEQDIIDVPYYTDSDSFEPRYYQRIAINRTVEAVARGQKRILLVMATGTGKTYTAFQIIHRLHAAKKARRILYIADRNILIDQTMRQDFKPFSKIMTKIKGKEPESGYEIYMSLYEQWVKPEEDLQPGEQQPYMDFAKDFFDFIVVDECHRSSAREDSEWRKILEHFSSATQLGLTATPKAEEGANNIEYFGEPVYTYSLSQGIQDGFLAPYRVTQSFLNVDLEGYHATPDEKDINGLPLDELYTRDQYGRKISITRRQKVVAHRITQMLRRIGRMTKTIVFCPDQEEADVMRNILIQENQDKMKKYPHYVVRITSDDRVGKKLLDDFIDPDMEQPVIATTSELLSTGVDCKTCGLIVFDKEVKSMTQFKQMLGRGTRIYDKNNVHKLSFEVLDFRNVTNLFADPDFDGPVVTISYPSGEKPAKGKKPQPPQEGDGDGAAEEHPQYKVHVEGHRGIKIVNEHVLYVGADGKTLTTESVTDYTRKAFKEKYATLDKFKGTWSTLDKKKILEDIDGGKELIDAVRDENPELKDMDIFDIVCHVAFDKKPLTRRERVNNVRKRGYLNKYNGQAREILDALIEKYQDNGILDFENLQTLNNDPFRRFGKRTRIMKLFGDQEGKGYHKALAEIENELYKDA